MSTSSSPPATVTVLGKRKVQRLVLHLESSPEPSRTQSDSDFEPPVDFHAPIASSSKLPPIVINGKIVENTKKRYKCTHNECTKAYSKPSRLEEHERSHTGDRPFVCETCHKSYLRETHLQAHVRSHLPESDRPFICPETACERRFWTTQHLKVHGALHKGAKLYLCTAASCDEAFAKNHQLRAHICAVHAPPGTKPYRCDNEGCMRSFATNQKLRTHSKVHDDKRYTCAHPSCLSTSSSVPNYFSTWTLLQHHTRTVHPPACHHTSCNGRTFASHHGLRAHLKLHEEREVEEQAGEAEGTDGEGSRPRKRRRGGEMGRDWKCEVDDCDKEFKSKKAMTTHHNVTHLGRRDHVCPHSGCGSTFGYKHLLQRHLTKVHSPQSTDGDGDDDDESEELDNVERKGKVAQRMDIDAITGKAYNSQAAERVSSSKALRCPHPHPHFLPGFTGEEARKPCAYVFSRSYDLRRHLLAEHGVVAEKDRVDEWVQVAKARGGKEAVAS